MAAGMSPIDAGKDVARAHLVPPPGKSCSALCLETQSITLDVKALSLYKPPPDIAGR